MMKWANWLAIKLADPRINRPLGRGSSVMFHSQSPILLIAREPRRILHLG
jgi:hypothetical protein